MVVRWERGCLGSWRGREGMRGFGFDLRIDCFVLECSKWEPRADSCSILVYQYYGAYFVG